MDIVLPSESTAVSEAEYKLAIEICEWTEALIQDRDRYIEDYGLDPAINNPSANWSKDSSVFSGYRTISGRDRIHLSLLRVFTQTFTGNFLGVRHAAGTPIPTSISPELDEMVEQCLRADSNPWWLQRHSKLVGSLPDLEGMTLPLAFGESGFRTRGAIVNHDLFVYLERLALLKSSGMLQRLNRAWWQFSSKPLLLEIGSGFGGLAYLVRQALPKSTYVCVDLPESLCFAALYLSRFFPNIHLATRKTDWSRLMGYDFVFMPNYMFHRLVSSGLAVDLAINTLSMSEMTRDQVLYYCSGIKSLIGDRGAFFEQNQDNRAQGLCFAGELAKSIFSEKRELSLNEMDLTQGAATVWSSSPL
jgi:hypothetical protein